MAELWTSNHFIDLCSWKMKKDISGSNGRGWFNTTQWKKESLTHWFEVLKSFNVLTGNSQVNFNAVAKIKDDLYCDARCCLSEHKENEHVITKLKRQRRFNVFNARRVQNFQRKLFHFRVNLISCHMHSLESYNSFLSSSTLFVD